MTALLPLDLGASAVLSPDGRYRYRLTRRWQQGTRPMLWIMLNPSTADASVDDQTIRKCLAYTRREGPGGIEVVNLFAARATDPSELDALADPVGPENDKHIAEAISACAVIIAAWGKSIPRAHRGRPARVLELLRGRNVYVLRRSGAAPEPRHPLYLPADTPIELWRPAWV